MSSKQKKVHYERGTKGGKSSSSHTRHHSRDSGIGSSSASDRASLGTADHDEYSYPDHQVEDQRYNLRVVQEALNAAYDKIQRLEASNASLNDSLTESNKENRALKKEKSGLIKENDDLLAAIYELNKRLKKESPPRISTSKPSSSDREKERRPSSRKGSDSPRTTTYTMDERPRSNHSDSHRRSSTVYDQTHVYASSPPLAPQAPYNPHPNPFAPKTSGVSYATVPVSVAYAPSTVSYSSTPLYTVTPHSSSSNRRSKEYDDGKYHLQPL